jgi:hypothetical protein
MPAVNYINHVVLVLDASWSMQPHVSNLIRVVDAQIEYMAKRSDELNQETRVSVYEFADEVSCLIYDMDVLRLPSIENLYQLHGNTALIDATLKSLEDLEKTATLYGDHAFLTYVLTDGEENRSRNRPTRLKDRLNGLPANWTVASLVPDQNARRYAISTGFPENNVAIWDTQSASGVIEVGKTIRQATDSFMESRSKGGFVGTRSLFSTGTDAINARTVHSNLTPKSPSEYDILPVHHDGPIREYVISRGLRYTVGNGFYQLTKRETIQASKKIMIREKSTGHIYEGDQARDLIGLPVGAEASVTPNYNPEYDVFVQSTSVNRKLISGTDVIVVR